MTPLLDTLRLTLEFDRSAVEAGQSWRLLSAGFVHLSIAHLLGNLAGLGLLTCLVAPSFGARAVLRAFACSSMAASLGIWMATDLSWYAGASGALWGVAGWYASRIEGRWGLPWLVLAAIVVTGDQSRVLSWSGEPMAPQAHLWGFVGGCLLGCIERMAGPVALRLGVRR